MFGKTECFNEKMKTKRVCHFCKKRGGKMGADLTFCHKVRSEHRYELQIRYSLFDTNNIKLESKQVPIEKNQFPLLSEKVKCFN